MKVANTTATPGNLNKGTGNKGTGNHGTSNQGTAAHLAANVESLRRDRSLSQQALSDLAGIPRSTITHIESGLGNPSLSNLCLLAAALGVSIEELLSRPREQVTLLRSDAVPVLQRGAGQVQLHKLMPDRVRGIEIDRLEMAPGGSMAGQPHIQGSKEYLMVTRGEVRVSVAGAEHRVKVGDVLAFPGDQRHGYRNATKRPASALSVVLPMPYESA
jgi:transcriptional regulator with XRE-family HTH domain